MPPGRIFFRHTALLFLEIQQVFLWKSALFGGEIPRPLDIPRLMNTGAKIAWIPSAVQETTLQKLSPFPYHGPVFAGDGSAKISIVKLDHAVKLMGPIPLAHRCADALEHIPGYVVRRSQLS